METQPVDILMYHSISDGGGPTCLAPDTFRAQMDAIGEAGYQVVSLASLAGAWPTRPTAILTFDDGFQDFADVAFPVLKANAWPATVFLPAGKVGGRADWPSVGETAGRPLMSWSTIRDLTSEGIEFGAHGVRHADLTAIPLDEARGEIADSKSIIEARTGCAVTSFAAPYGRSNNAIRSALAALFTQAVGTAFGPARPKDSRFSLPRLEMWYFRSPRRWKSYLGGARGYLRLRQSLRRLGQWIPSH